MNPKKHHGKCIASKQNHYQSTETTARRAEVKTRPDFLRSSLEMISQLLLASDPPNSPAHMVERTKQVQQAASMAFKDICVGGKHHLQVRWADGR